MGGGAMRRVCVIGATGFIGKRTVSILSNNGFYIVATHRDGSSVPEELTKSSGIELRVCDIEDPSSITAAISGCEVVCNCAGVYRWWVPDKGVYHTVNCVGARNVAVACNEATSVKHLLHISTAMAFGYPLDKPFTEESCHGPHAAEYTRTKFLGDEAVCAAHRQGGSTYHLTILYLGCVTGAGDTLAVGRPSAVYRDFMLGKIPLLIAPDTYYIYVHIRDVEQAVLRATTTSLQIYESTSQSPTRNSTSVNKFLIGNSEDMITTRQYFELMSEFCDVQCPRFSINVTVGFVLGYFLTLISTWITGWAPLMPVDVMRTAYWGGIEYDCSKSVRELGLQYTPIKVAVREAMEDIQGRQHQQEATCSCDKAKVG